MQILEEIERQRLEKIKQVNKTIFDGEKKSREAFYQVRCKGHSFVALVRSAAPPIVCSLNARALICTAPTAARVTRAHPSYVAGSAQQR
jgi:hypothetical protein